MCFLHQINVVQKVHVKLRHFVSQTVEFNEVVDQTLKATHMEKELSIFGYLPVLSCKTVMSQSPSRNTRG